VWRRCHVPVALLVLSALMLAGCDVGSDSDSADSAGTDSAGRQEQTAGGGQTAGETTEGGGPVYVGAQPGIPVEAVPFGDRRARPAVLETSGDSLVTGVRWQGWGAQETVGRGDARVNSCEPNCAEGRLTRRPGVTATLSDLRRGDCRGRPARFYVRAVVEWPGGLGLPPRQEFKLLPRCAEVG
jgi:hypothetical protein